MSEEATRLGEFSKGVKKEGAQKAGLQESAFASREVTLDFQRIGAKTKAVNSLIAFWNANVQGTDKMIRAFKEKPVTTTFKVSASITLPSVILTIVNNKDERWKEIPQWQKDLFWIVMTEKNIYRIPKPFEVGIIFGTVPERITQYILDEDPHAFDGLLKSIGRGASPGVIPTVAVPLMENWANKSIFLDRPIVPRAKEDLLPQYQDKPYTTEIAKKLGGLVAKLPSIGDTGAASPAKIENLIRGWSGGLGTSLLRAADLGLRKAGIVPDKVDPTPVLADMPVIKAFAVRYPSASTESIQRFYDNYEKATRRRKTGKYLMKEGKLQEAEKVLSQGNIVKLTSVKKGLKALHKYVSKIYANPDITPDEKRKLIDQAYVEMINVARYGNKILEGTSK